MKKMKSLVVGSLLTLSLAGSIMIDTPYAHAANWHKGAPKALIGKYKMKFWVGDGAGIYSNQYLTRRIYIKKNKIEMPSYGMPGIKMYHLKYKKTGRHTYYIRGSHPTEGMVLAGKNEINEIKVVKNGNKIKYRLSPQSGSYFKWLKKY